MLAHLGCRYIGGSGEVVAPFGSVARAKLLLWFYNMYNIDDGQVLDAESEVGEAGADEGFCGFGFGARR